MALNEPFLVALQFQVSTSKALKPYGSVLTDYSRVGSRWFRRLHILTAAESNDARIQPMPLECAFRQYPLRCHSVEWHNKLGWETGGHVPNGRWLPYMHVICYIAYTYQYGISYMI